MINGIPVLVGPNEREHVQAVVVHYHKDRLREGFSVSTGQSSCC